MKPTVATIVRIVLLAVALVNMALSTLGVVPEEVVGNTQAYKIGSYIVTAVISIATAWYNNSFTKEAILADEYFNALKAAAKGEDKDSEA